MNHSLENPFELRNRMIANTMQRIRHEYGRLPDPDSMLHNQLCDLYDTFNGFNNVRGKLILDVGCGCLGGTSEVDSNRQWRIFEPWLCRTIEILGGRAIGIDIGAFGKEKFEMRRIDLLEKDPLAEFETGSFDAVNCRLLLSSPHLCGITTREKRIILRDMLRSELSRVLKPDGKWICFDDDI